MKKSLCAVIWVVVVVVLMFGASAASAQKADSQSAVRAMTSAETAQAWADSGIGGGIDFPFPPAPAAISVVGQPDTRVKKVTAIVHGPISKGYILFDMILPGGQVIPLKGTSVENVPKESYLQFELWNGEFPYWWLDGATQFETYVIQATGGSSAAPPMLSIARTKASVLLGFSCCASSPEIGSIVADSSNAAITVVVSGGAQENLEVIVAGRPVLPSPTFGMLRIPLPFNMDGSERSLTICARGECTTRTFYVPPSSGGKG